MIQFFVVLFNLEIGNKISCNHRADAVNGADFIRICMADGFQVIIKMAADHFCIGKADIGDSKTVNDFCQSGGFCFFQTP